MIRHDVIHTILTQCSGLKKKRALRGIKAVNKSLRKQRNGIVVIAADSAPLDVVSHLPEYAADKNVPVVWVPSKKSLGESCLAKRPCCAVMLIKPDDNDDLRELYDKCLKIAEKANKKK
jgi:U4/U6 small nuclear ribonucleoprotein SNU13